MLALVCAALSALSARSLQEEPCASADMIDTRTLDPPAWCGTDPLRKQDKTLCEQHYVSVARSSTAGGG